MNVFLLLFLLASGPAVAEQASGDKLLKDATHMLTLIDQGKYDEVIARFDDRMTRTMTREKLEEHWKGVTSSAGAYKGVYKAAMAKISGFDVAQLDCDFEKMKLRATFAFDKEGKVAAFQMGLVP